MVIWCNKARFFFFVVLRDFSNFGSGWGDENKTAKWSFCSPEFCLKLTYRYLLKAGHVSGETPGRGHFVTRGII